MSAEQPRLLFIIHCASFSINVAVSLYVFIFSVLACFVGYNLDLVFFLSLMRWVTKTFHVALGCPILELFVALELKSLPTFGLECGVRAPYNTFTRTTCNLNYSHEYFKTVKHSIFNRRQGNCETYLCSRAFNGSLLSMTLRATQIPRVPVVVTGPVTLPWCTPILIKSWGHPWLPQFEKVVCWICNLFFCSDTSVKLQTPTFVSKYLVVVFSNQILAINLS